MTLTRRVRSSVQAFGSGFRQLRRWLSSARIWDWLFAHADAPIARRKRRRAPLGVEILENRDCPSIVVTYPGYDHTFYAEIGDEIDIQVTAYETNSHTLMITAASAGFAPSLGITDGRYTGTLASQDVGDWGLDVEVLDTVTSDYIDHPFNLHVNGPPTIDEEIDNQENDEGDPISLQVVASDPNELDELTLSPFPKVLPLFELN